MSFLSFSRTKTSEGSFHESAFSAPNARLHAHRITGRHRHHRHLDLAVAACRATSSRGSRPQSVQETSQTIGISSAKLRKHVPSVTADERSELLAEHAGLFAAGSVTGFPGAGQSAKEARLRTASVHRAVQRTGSESAVCGGVRSDASGGAVSERSRANPQHWCRWLAVLRDQLHGQLRQRDQHEIRSALANGRHRLRELERHVR